MLVTRIMENLGKKHTTINFRLTRTIPKKLLYLTEVSALLCPSSEERLGMRARCEICRAAQPNWKTKAREQ